MFRRLSKILTGLEPAEMRDEMTQGSSDDLTRRRMIIGLSILGLGTAAAASLLQTGVVRHLPDPPIGNFDADAVVTSDAAYQFGIPDAAIALVGLAANVPLAAWGGRDRAKLYPFIPLAAAGKSAVEAASAGWYFYQMPAKLKKWCGYCVVAAGVYFTIFALTLPEAKNAISALRKSEGRYFVRSTRKGR
jgi:uncharacterized membrane protein